MLILKQNAANTVPTPPAGKGTIFLNPSDDLAVKTADGNVATFPTAGGSNTQVYFNDDGSFGANANFVYNKSTSVLTITGNVAATRVLTDNLLYANGTAWDLSDPGGSNTQIQFNDQESFGGSAAFTFNNSSNLVTVAANLNANNLNATTHITSGNVWANSGIIGALTLKGEGGNISNIQGGNVSGAVGSATTAGTVTTAAQPNITSVGTLTSLDVNGNITAANITANTGVFTGNGSGLSAIAGANVSGAVGSATTAGTVTTAAQPNITSVGTLSSLTATGNVTGGNLVTAGKVYASEMINGGTGIYLSAGPSGYINFFTTGGDKASISDSGNIVASNLVANSTVFAVTANISGNVNAGNVSGTLLTGTLTTNAQPNITSVGTLTSLSVTGNVAGGNLTTVGVLSVTGTGVSSIAGNLDMTSNTIINLATPSDPSDAATKQYVDDVAQGLHTHDSCGAATPDTLANITSGTITYNNGASGVGANLVTTGSFNLIDGVNVQTAGTRILVKNEANSAHNGIYTWSNATVITRATDFDTPAEMAGGDFTFITAGTLYDNTGWVMTDAVTTVGTSPVPWVQFSGAGTYTAGTGLTLTGSQFSVNASQTQITTVGTLGSLAVTGNITAGNVSATTFTGALSGAATTAGTVTTAAQPNITSVGTLTSLAVTGNISAGNVSATTFTGSLSGAATSATTAGTVTTAAQPNITSVGTLTSLAVTGNISAGNVSATTFTGALSGAATTAGTVTTAAQPNITSVGTLTSLTSSGNISGANVVSSAYSIVSVGTGISGNSTAQPTGTVLSKEFNVVSTATYLNNAVVLPVAVAGMRITVLNTSGSNIQVFPAANGIINSAAANAAYTHPIGARLDYISISTTQWYTLNATYG
jgi:hypothetical protein